MPAGIISMPKVNGIPGFSDERQTAGRKWLCGFLLRHPDITLKKAHNLSIARAMGANPTDQKLV